MLIDLHPDEGERHGRLLNLVYAVRSGQQLTRDFTPPSNPQTSIQQEVRTSFGDASKVYSSMTPAQIAAWGSLASNYTRHDLGGSEYTLSGQMLFQSVNHYRALKDLNATKNAPAFSPCNTTGSIDGCGKGASITHWRIPKTGVPHGTIALIRAHIVDDWSVPSQPNDYEFPTADPKHAFVTCTLGSDVHWYLRIYNTDLRGPFDSMPDGAFIRSRILLLTSAFLIPQLERDESNFYGENIVE